MSMTNCKNCGAALDIWEPKCQFCGTRNINLTALDLASGEPANFIFRMPHNIKVVNEKNEEIYMTVLAVPSLEDIVMTSDSIDAYGGWSNNKLISAQSNYNVELGLKLTTVYRENTNSYATIKVGDK